MGTAINHTGIAVTDLERAKRFYQEVLGFEPWFEIHPPDEASATLLGLTPPLGSTASYLTLGAFVLELLHYGAPGASAPYRPRVMNEPGLTHLSIAVDDLRATCAKAIECGGEVVEASDIGAAIFIRDPDGQLLELLPAAYRDRLPPRPTA